MTTNFAFLHGGGQGSWVWDELLPILHASGAETLALDVPGCGVKRGRDVSALTVADIVDELVSDIRTWGRSDIILVGHSQAGTILPLLQAAIDDRIKRLVYLSCCAPLPGKTLLDQIGNTVRGRHPDEVGRPLDPATATREDMYTAMFFNEVGPKQAAAFVAKLGNDGWPMSSMFHSDWSYAHLTNVPSTFILCEQDQALPAHWQYVFAGRLLCQHIVTIDAGHQPMNTQPEKLAQMLLAEAKR